MRKLRGWVAFLGLLALGALGAAACGDDGSPGGTGGTGCKLVDAAGCYDASCVVAGPTRSFATDVLPIFRQSCGLSMSCHGNPASPTDANGYRPYLGEAISSTNPTDVAKIRALIIGQPSKAATLSIVEPGKPEASFLMLKMDGAHKCAANGCTKCGDSMPQGGILLDIEPRNVVRDWIAQGALDN